MRWIVSPALVTITAVAFAAAPSVSAEASGRSVPAPTVTVATRVAGQTLPVSPMQASWTITRPGRRATLKVTGPAAAPSETTVRSTWISSWRWARAREVAFGASVQADFTDLAAGAANNRFTLRIDARTHGRHWQPVAAVTGSHNTQLLLTAGQGIGMQLGSFDRVRLQWRVRLTAKFYDTSNETLTESLALS